MVAIKSDKGYFVEMAEAIEVLRKDDLKDGEIRKVELGKLGLLVARIGGEFYCLESACRHLGEDLSRGTLEGTVLTCPRDHSQFDIRDGHVVRWMDLQGIPLVIAKALKPPRPLQVYKVQIEGERILIEP